MFFFVDSNSLRALSIGIETNILHAKLSDKTVWFGCTDEGTRVKYRVQLGWCCISINIYAILIWLCRRDVVHYLSTHLSICTYRALDCAQSPITMPRWGLFMGTFWAQPNQWVRYNYYYNAIHGEWPTGPLSPSVEPLSYMNITRLCSMCNDSIYFMFVWHKIASLIMAIMCAKGYVCGVRIHADNARGLFIVKCFCVDWTRVHVMYCRRDVNYDLLYIIVICIRCLVTF